MALRLAVRFHHLLRPALIAPPLTRWVTITAALVIQNLTIESTDPTYGDLPRNRGLVAKSTGNAQET